jgi:tellurite resistance protein
MPRPKKQNDLVASVLEVAHGNLSHVLETVQPTTRLRIEQAIRRHPDLSDLLDPIKSELEEIQKCTFSAKTEVRTAIKLIWKM